MKYKYKALVKKVTLLPVGGVTLIPGVEFETNTDLSGYVKVGYVKDLTPAKVVEPVVEHKGPGRPKKSS